MATIEHPKVSNSRMGTDGQEEPLVSLYDVIEEGVTMLDFILAKIPLYPWWMKAIAAISVLSVASLILSVLFVKPRQEDSIPSPPRGADDVVTRSPTDGSSGAETGSKNSAVAPEARPEGGKPPEGPRPARTAVLITGDSANNVFGEVIVRGGAEKGVVVAGQAWGNVFHKVTTAGVDTAVEVKNQAKGNIFGKVIADSAKLER